jgi:hypothetical protein
MRKPAILLGLILVAGSASGQDLQSYPPSKATTAPTFVNAEVVRVDAAGTTTFRSESGEELLAAGSEVTAGLRLRPGQKVLVSFRTMLRADGRESRVVTEVREASPSSGEPGRSASVSASGNVRTVRVLRTDRRRRTVTVFDETGGLSVLPVSRGIASQLATLNAGDTVALTLGGVAPNGSLASASVVGFVPANAASFALPGTFPSLNGTFVRSSGNEITLNTTAGPLTFPVSGGMASNLRGLRPGENLSLSFDVTTVSNATRGAGGPDAVRPASLTAGNTGARIANVTGIAPAVAQAAPFQAAGAGQARTPVAPNLVSPNAPGLAGLPNQQGQVPGTAGVASGTGAPVGAAGAAQAGVAGGGQAGVAGGTPGAANAGAGTGTTAGTGPVLGGAVVVGGGPTSPLTSNLPSVQAAAPVVTAVLPPAVAKAPLSAEEVGTQREQGLRDLDAAAVTLAAVANDIDVVWASFKNQCLAGFTAAQRTSGREWYLLFNDEVRTPGDDACRATYAGLLGRAKGFQGQLDTVEDAARKADVLPVHVREVFERHRLR